MSPNHVNLQGFVTSMVPKPVNVYGLVTSMAPTHENVTRVGDVYGPLGFLSCGGLPGVMNLP